MENALLSKYEKERAREKKKSQVRRAAAGDNRPAANVCVYIYIYSSGMLCPPGVIYKVREAALQMTNNDAEKSPLGSFNLGARERAPLPSRFLLLFSVFLTFELGASEFLPTRVRERALIMRAIQFARFCPTTLCDPENLLRNL